MHSINNTALDQIDRMIIEATQAGLPVTPKPYHKIATQLDLEPELVMQRIRSLLRQYYVLRQIDIQNIDHRQILLLYLFHLLCQ